MTRTIDTLENVPAEEKKRSVWKPLAAAGIGGAVLVATGFGVFAQLQATANNTVAQAVNTGDLKLVLGTGSNLAGTASAGFTTAISNLAPADTVTRLVTLTNSGSLAGKDLKLAVTAGTSNLLSTDATRGLQITVENCTVAWTSTPGTTAATTGKPTCVGGTESVAVASTPLASFAAAKPMTANTAAGAINNLLVTVGLPEQTETSVNGGTPSPAVGTGSIQQLNNALTFTFTEVQRDATNTNS